MTSKGRMYVILNKVTGLSTVGIVIVGRKQLFIILGSSNTVIALDILGRDLK
jgi:hypothetical protein